MQETWVQSLGQKDLLGKKMATHSSIHAWRIPWTRGVWWATVHGFAKTRTWLSDFTFTLLCITRRKNLGVLSWKLVSLWLNNHDHLANFLVFASLRLKAHQLKGRLHPLEKGLCSVLVYACVCAKPLQSCPDLCNSMDCSSSDSSCPWDSPGMNTGVGCHVLLPGVLLSQGLDPCLLHCRLFLYPLSHLGSCTLVYTKIYT